MTMTRISNEAPRTAALLRVYRGYCSLNAAAMRLLNVGYERSRYAELSVSDDGTVWICTTNNSADYKITPKSSRTGRINSVTLCRQLADKLGDYGTYRITPERRQYDVTGDKFYYAISKQR